ncbi:uncharacterized protein LOC103709215 [Phoenix dactylifera]|uniref:Uncharacterized protein LOC103709215 n=1 Tax=Phoenix dactylifera TaxID=42345 RepID=A0A8B7C6H3_PHODC|nr:uncharacterized protein LOC103709215 [Phoenix dactylifera]
MEFWWDRVVIPMRRVWINVATRIGNRKTGLWKLRKEVRTCEYEDVHVMWEMLRKTDTEIGRYPPAAMGGCNKNRRRRMRHRRRARARGGVWAAVLEWAPYSLCRDF